MNMVLYGILMYEKKPMFRKDGTVLYPWHKWQSGKDDTSNQSFDVWIAFEFNPQLSALPWKSPNEKPSIHICQIDELTFQRYRSYFFCLIFAAKLSCHTDFVLLFLLSCYCSNKLTLQMFSSSELIWKKSRVYPIGCKSVVVRTGRQPTVNHVDIVYLDHGFNSINLSRGFWIYWTNHRGIIVFPKRRKKMIKSVVVGLKCSSIGVQNSNHWRCDSGVYSFLFAIAHRCIFRRCGQ